MFLRLSSVFVPNADCDEYLKHLHTVVLPHHERAEGLICVWLSQRTLIGYSEFVVIAIWCSEQALVKYDASVKDAGDNTRTSVQRMAPEVYRLVAIRPGGVGGDKHNGSWPDQKEGAD
jgi:hypothetical protein